MSSASSATVSPCSSSTVYLFACSNPSSTVPLCARYVSSCDVWHFITSWSHRFVPIFMSKKLSLIPFFHRSVLLVLCYKLNKPSVANCAAGHMIFNGDDGAY